MSIISKQHKEQENRKSIPYITMTTMLRRGRGMEDVTVQSEDARDMLSASAREFEASIPGIWSETFGPKWL
jgi:hypothetical protein